MCYLFSCLKFMGNIFGRRRSGSRRSNPPPPPPPPPQSEITANRYVFAAAAPYPSQYPNPNPPPQPQYYQYPPPGYYPPAPYGHHHRGAAPPPPHFDTAAAHGAWDGGRHPCVPVSAPHVTYVEHQKAVTIRNDVNIKKETLRIVADEQNPGRFLVTFTFDAAVAGSVAIVFFAKEGEDCSMTPIKESILKPVTVPFEPGLGQKFRQPSGTGIDFSMFDETELLKHDEMGIYPLAVKAESAPASQTGSVEDPGSMNYQITQALFERDKGEYRVRVVKQILWVNGMRYELQEIYGIGNSVDDSNDNDTGKECVICLSEPRDTAVLPCRHMCMCSGCAQVLKYQANGCPICRHPVERLLEIRVGNGSDE